MWWPDTPNGTAGATAAIGTQILDRAGVALAEILEAFIATSPVSAAKG